MTEMQRHENIDEVTSATSIFEGGPSHHVVRDVSAANRRVDSYACFANV
jgi:hypothetical protein